MDPKPCSTAHVIAGYMPQPSDIQFDQKTCDCGRILFVAEYCGCPNNPEGKQLRSRANPNYIPS